MYEGWAKYNRHYWRRDWGGFAEFFFSQVYNEPHSTKPTEDCVGWALETDAETILTMERAPYLDSPAAHRRRQPSDRPPTLDFAARVRCPCLVIHGSRDWISDLSGGKRLAEAVGGDIAVLEGSGHCPQARDPVAAQEAMSKDLMGLTKVPGYWESLDLTAA